MQGSRWVKEVKVGSGMFAQNQCWTEERETALVSLPIGSLDGRSVMPSHLFPITGLASDHQTGPLVLPRKDCGLELSVKLGLEPLEIPVMCPKDWLFCGVCSCW